MWVSLKSVILRCASMKAVIGIQDGFPDAKVEDSECALLPVWISYCRIRGLGLPL